MEKLLFEGLMQKRKISEEELEEDFLEPYRKRRREMDDGDDDCIGVLTTTILATISNKKPGRPRGPNIVRDNNAWWSKLYHSNKQCNVLIKCDSVMVSARIM